MSKKTMYEEMDDLRNAIMDVLVKLLGPTVEWMAKKLDKWGIK